MICCVCAHTRAPFTTTLAEALFFDPAPVGRFASGIVVGDVCFVFLSLAFSLRSLPRLRRALRALFVSVATPSSILAPHRAASLPKFFFVSRFLCVCVCVRACVCVVVCALAPSLRAVGASCEFRRVRVLGREGDASRRWRSPYRGFASTSWKKLNTHQFLILINTMTGQGVGASTSLTRMNDPGPPPIFIFLHKTTVL